MMNMTDEEIKAMVGTEFIYVFSDHSEIPAIIAAYDPEIGLTCLATSLVTNKGLDFSNRIDKNGNFCLIGYDKHDILEKRNQMIFVLKNIQHLGFYTAHSSRGFGYNSSCGNAACSF